MTNVESPAVTTDTTLPTGVPIRDAVNAFIAAKQALMTVGLTPSDVSSVAVAALAEALAYRNEIDPTTIRTILLESDPVLRGIHRRLQGVR